MLNKIKNTNNFKAKESYSHIKIDSFPVLKNEYIPSYFKYAYLYETGRYKAQNIFIQFFIIAFYKEWNGKTQKYLCFSCVFSLFFGFMFCIFNPTHNLIGIISLLFTILSIIILLFCLKCRYNIDKYRDYNCKIIAEEKKTMTHKFSWHDFKESSDMFLNK